MHEVREWSFHADLIVKLFNCFYFFYFTVCSFAKKNSGHIKIRSGHMDLVHHMACWATEKKVSVKPCKLCSWIMTEYVKIDMLICSYVCNIGFTRSANMPLPSKGPRVPVTVTWMTPNQIRDIWIVSKFNVRAGQVKVWFFSFKRVPTGSGDWGKRELNST